MDFLRRVAIFLLPLLGGLVFSCSSKATNYDYTGKVSATTGGQQKVTTNDHQAGSWSPQLPTNNPCSYTTLAEYVSCWASYSTSHNPPYQYTPHTQTTGNMAGTTVWRNSGQGCVSMDYTGPSSGNTGNSCFTSVCPAGYTDSGTADGPDCLKPTTACPSGTVENQTDHLCYALICPSVSSNDPNQNQWQQDPNDSTQCRRVTSCPWAASWSDGTCVCPNSSITAQAQYGVGSYFLQGSLAPGASTCLGGCEVQVGAPAVKITVNGSPETVAPVTAGSGATFCNSPAPSPQKVTDVVPTAESSCLSAGGSWGTVNGVGTCLPKGGAGTTVVQTTPTTTTSTANNPNGTSTVTTTTTTPTTTCVSGQCTTTNVITTTTTNYTGPNGTGTASSGGSGTTTTTGSSSPGGSGSGNGTGTGAESSFGGSCSSGFACQGDAVQCAIAQEQYKRNCEVLTDAGGLSRADAVSKFDSDRTFDRTQLNATPTALGSLDSSAFLSSGCIADLHTSLMGQSLTIPFSSLCSYLQYIGYAFMTVCSLIAFRVVAGGVN